MLFHWFLHKGVAWVLIVLVMVCVNCSAIDLPKPTIIEEQARPVTDNILWLFEDVFKFVIESFDWVITWICFPFRYVTGFLLASIEVFTTVPIFITTLFINMVDFILRLPFIFLRNLINNLFELLICFPANAIVTLASLVIHAPLNFIGINIHPYLTWWIVSFDIFVVNMIHRVVGAIFNSITYIVVDVVLQGLVKLLLELPVWTVYHVIRFPVILGDMCIEITYSVLILLVSRTFTIVCSLLRLLCFVVTYAVIFIGYWSLDIFLILMTVIIGCAAWLSLAAIFVLVYLSVRVFRKQESVLKIVQTVVENYHSIQNPHIKVALEVLLEMFPKELWIKLQNRLQGMPDILVGDEIVCEICYESQCFVKLIPCGHNNICKTCVEEIRRRTNTCPMCRANIVVYI